MKKNISALLTLLLCAPYFLNAATDGVSQKIGEETVTVAEDLVFTKFPVPQATSSDGTSSKFVKFVPTQIVDGKPAYLLTLQETKARQEGTFSLPTFVTNMYHGGTVYENVPEKSILVNDKVASVVTEEGYRKFFVSIDKQKVGPYDEVIRLYSHNNKLYFYARVGKETYLYNELGEKVVGPFQVKDPYIQSFVMSYPNSSDRPLHYTVDPVKDHLTKDESNRFISEIKSDKKVSLFSLFWGIFKKKDNGSVNVGSNSVYKISVGSTTLAISDFPMRDITVDTSNPENVAYVRNYYYRQGNITSPCYGVADLKGWVVNQCKDKGVSIPHLKAYDSQNNLLLFRPFSSGNTLNTLVLSKRGVEESHAIASDDDVAINNGKLLEINTKGQSSIRKEVLDIKYDGKSILAELELSGLRLFKGTPGYFLPSAVAYMIDGKVVMLVTDENNNSFVLTQK